MPHPAARAADPPGRPEYVCRYPLYTEILYRVCGQIDGVFIEADRLA